MHTCDGTVDDASLLQLYGVLWGGYSTNKQANSNA